MAASTRSSSSGKSNSHYSYVCVECGESFLNAADLKDHEISIHSGHRIECERCGAGFRSKTTFDGHICQLLLSHVVPVSGRSGGQRSLSLDSFIEYSVTRPTRFRRPRRLSSQTKPKSISDVTIFLNGRVEESVVENRFMAPSNLNSVSNSNSETEEIMKFDSRFDKPDFEQEYSTTIPLSSPRCQIPLITDSFADLSIDDGTTSSTRVILDSKRKRRPESVLEDITNMAVPKKMAKKSGLSENDDSLMQNFDDDDDDADWKRILLGESFVYFLSQVVQQKQQQKKNIRVVGNVGGGNRAVQEGPNSTAVTTNPKSEFGKFFSEPEKTKNLVIETQIPIVIAESDSNYLISHSPSIPKVGLEKSSDLWFLKASSSTFVPDGPKGPIQLDPDDGYDEAEAPIPNCLKPNKSQWNCYLCFHLLKEGTPTELQTHLDDHIDNCQNDEDKIFNFATQPEPIQPVVSPSSTLANLLVDNFQALALEIPTSRFRCARMPDESHRRVTPDPVYEREMHQEMERLAKVAKRRSSRRTVSWD